MHVNDGNARISGFLTASQLRGQTLSVSDTATIENVEVGNTLIGAGINTGFEQYQDIFIKLGLAASYDDLRTDGSASSALQKQSGEFTELAGTYGFSYDVRDRSFMPTRGNLTSFSQSIPIYAEDAYFRNSFSTLFR